MINFQMNPELSSCATNINNGCELDCPSVVSTSAEIPQKFGHTRLQMSLCLSICLNQRAQAFVSAGLQRKPT